MVKKEYKLRFTDLRTSIKMFTAALPLTLISILCDLYYWDRNFVYTISVITMFFWVMGILYLIFGD